MLLLLLLQSCCKQRWKSTFSLKYHAKNWIFRRQNDPPLHLFSRQLLRDFSGLRSKDPLSSMQKTGRMGAIQTVQNSKYEECVCVCLPMCIRLNVQAQRVSIWMWLIMTTVKKQKHTKILILHTWYSLFLIGKYRWVMTFFYFNQGDH